jgi:hypothetical protein
MANLRLDEWGDKWGDALSAGVDGGGRMVAVGGISAYLAHHAIVGNARCRRTLDSLTAIDPPTALSILCSLPSSLFQLLLVAAFLTFMALAWRDWWRWNKDHA